MPAKTKSRSGICAICQALRTSLSPAWRLCQERHVSHDTSDAQADSGTLQCLECTSDRHGQAAVAGSSVPSWDAQAAAKRSTITSPSPASQGHRAFEQWPPEVMRSNGTAKQADPPAPWLSVKPTCTTKTSQPGCQNGPLHRPLLPLFSSGAPAPRAKPQLNSPKAPPRRAQRPSGLP